jgi:hypothetical protein
MSLIRNIDQFRAYVIVNYGTNLQNLGPDMRVAERQRIRPTLGPALYNDLSALSDDDLAAALADPADVRGGLLRLVQEAVANLAALEYLVLNQVQISSSGVHIFSDAAKKTAFQWQIKDLQGYFRRKGYNALEEVLTYLEAHADDFPGWASSAAAIEARALFINSAAEFSTHYDIAGSRLTYNALLATMRKVERFRLKAVLGAEYYDELKALLRAGTQLSFDDEYVLEEYVRPALAHLVVAKAVPEVGIGFNGAALELNVYRFDDANQKEADASIDALLTKKIAQAEADAQVFLTDLRRYLNRQASATKYATYFASSTYTDPQAPRPTVRTAVDSPTIYFG